MRIRQSDHAVVSAVNLGEASLASSYNALLASDASLARDTWDALAAAQRRDDLRVADRYLCNVLRPRFLSDGRTRELAQASETVAALMERAGALLLRRDDLLRAIGATEAEQEMWAIDPGYPGFTLTSRLDSFMVGNDPRFIEYNAESPAGIAFVDLLARIFFSLPSIPRWAEDRRLWAHEARRALLETLLWAFRQWGGKGTPRVAIIDWEHVITRRDFEIIAGYFREHHVETVIVDPRRVEYRNGVAEVRGERVDLIYRRVLLHELLDKASEARDLFRAYRDGAVCMVNSPRSKLLHKKALLALLSDGRLDLHLSEAEKAVVEATIPWTRMMIPGETTYAGKSIDLERFVADNGERLALKPVDDYGGRGVVLGWDCAPEEWYRAIELAMSDAYVVQERVPVAEGEFPVWNGSSVEVLPLLVDTNPLMFRGRMGGILTRTSSEALLNVSAGTGSSTATLITGD
jgi:hypothetical protein